MSSSSQMLNIFLLRSLLGSAMPSALTLSSLLRGPFCNFLSSSIVGKVSPMLHQEEDEPRKSYQQRRNPSTEKR